MFIFESTGLASNISRGIDLGFYVSIHPDVIIYAILMFFCVEEMRIRWLQTQNYLDSVLRKMKEIYFSDNMIGDLLSIVGVNWQKKRGQVEEQYDATKRAGEKQYEHAKDQGGKQWEEAKRRASEASEKAGQWVQDKKGDVKEKVGEKVKDEGQKIKEEL